METFDESRLRQQIAELPPDRQVLFAAIIAARMAAGYGLYCRKRQLGDEARFEAALAFLWSQLCIASPDVPGAKEHLAQVLELVPEEDDNWGELSAQADDSASSLAYALRCLIKPKPEEAAWAARRAYETRDNLVIQHSAMQIGGSNEMAVLGSPSIQAELKQQQFDLQVAGSTSTDRSDLKALYLSCLDKGATFFGGL